MKIQSQFFEDYALGSSRETLGRTLTEADIVLHAGQTGDFYPHHMDKEWCATQPFGQRIAHGTLILSIAIGMTAGDVNPEAFSYGYDRVRFIKPVFINDTLRVKASIKEKRDHHKNPSYGFVAEFVEVFNQQQETVLACEPKSLPPMHVFHSSMAQAVTQSTPSMSIPIPSPNCTLIKVMWVSALS
jgi:acyl dehydratase